ncbi:Gag-Pol polyprotein [Trachymyrmex cornetzi]|uniref:ribonuclease H n=1 Tax=Trachymyrmex cornetzi TaxID=471704 RepID=A0A151J938_9HYME|nr:Gag-Pol polyprotein [Trachymyrmex cornetzi]
MAFESFCENAINKLCPPSCLQFNYKSLRKIKYMVISTCFFLQNKGLDISPTKPQCMIFSNKKSIIEFQPPKVNGRDIPVLDECKFLGVWFDRRMTGKTHLKYIVEKGKRVINIMTSLSGVWWGSNPQALLTIYRAVFRGSIEYGCFKRYKTIFTCPPKRLQWRAIRIAFGYRLSTPTNVMLAETRETPLKIRFNYLVTKYLIKNFSRYAVIPGFYRISADFALNNEPRGCTRPSRMAVRSRLIFKMAGLPAKMSKKTGSVHFSPVGIDKQTSKEHILGQLQEFILPLIQEAYVCFYTDGSKSEQDGCTGAGVYSPMLQLETAHRLPAKTTIFTTEAWALLVVLKRILDSDTPKAVIFTDSKSVLEAIASSRLNNGNYLIYAIKNQIYHISNANLHVKLAWIPSHRGIEGNEIADELAKLGAKQGDRIEFGNSIHQFILGSQLYCLGTI